MGYRIQWWQLHLRMGYLMDRQHGWQRDAPQKFGAPDLHEALTALPIRRLVQARYAWPIRFL